MWRKKIGQGGGVRGWIKVFFFTFNDVFPETEGLEVNQPFLHRSQLYQTVYKIDRDKNK